MEKCTNMGNTLIDKENLSVSLELRAMKLHILNCIVIKLFTQLI